MHTIWKVVVPIDDQVHEMSLPLPFKIVHVDMQEVLDTGAVAMWVKVVTDRPTMTRKFAVIGTGHDTYAHGPSEYIGTAKMAYGQVMWHVIEIVGPIVRNYPTTEGR